MMNWKGKPSANLSDYAVARIGYNNTAMGVPPSAEEVHNLACALQSSNTLIEEQAARIATLEQERDDAIVRFLKQEDRAEASEARLSEAVKVLERLAEGERSDEGHTALRDAAKAFIATLGETT